jgi:hypothetical protein
LFASQDFLLIIDHRNNRAVLKRDASEVPVANALREASTDLKDLSIRQFRTKRDSRTEVG